jgi:hypothetical protein
MYVFDRSIEDGRYGSYGRYGSCTRYTTRGREDRRRRCRKDNSSRERIIASRETNTIRKEGIE